MLNENNLPIEDQELDSLLKRVDVPTSLKDSLLAIPQLEEEPNAVKAEPVSRSLTTMIGTLAALAASVLIYFSLTNMTVVENANDIAASEEVSELLSKMRENLASMDRIEESAKSSLPLHEHQSTTPILYDDAVATALSLSWESALEQGASLGSVRSELQFVVDHYPNTSGADLAKRLLVVN